MTTLERLGLWKRTGIISAEQHGTFSALVRKERFSVFLELNALLYLGVLSLVAGLGWTFQTYFTSLGDAFILLTLSLMLAGSLYYCFSRGSAYSNEEVESPNLVFDYVLYLGCLLLSVELGYIEFRFQLLRDAWDYYLILSTASFFFLAYRFDNRLVLSLALSSLAAWFGVKVSVSRFGFMSESLRISALFYGAVVATGGTFLYRQKVKKHFIETYLHIAVNVIFIATVSGLTDRSSTVVYFLFLVVLATSAIVLGVRFKRFAFVVYGTVYGYIGLSIELLRSVSSFTIVLGYLVLTGSGVIILIALLARRFGREE